MVGLWYCLTPTSRMSETWGFAHEQIQGYINKILIYLNKELKQPRLTSGCLEMGDGTLDVFHS